MPHARLQAHALSGPTSAGAILIAHLVSGLSQGASSPQLPVPVYGRVWFAGGLAWAVAHFALNTGCAERERELVPETEGMLTMFYLLTSFAFWAGAAFTLVLFDLPLLALCWEPWSHQARLDWLVWQAGPGSLTPLLRRRPLGQAFASSWWPVRLLRAGLRGMLALVSAVESSERGCICARMKCLMRHLPCV